MKIILNHLHHRCLLLASMDGWSQMIQQDLILYHIWRRNLNFLWLAMCQDCSIVKRSESQIFFSRIQERENGCYAMNQDGGGIQHKPGIQVQYWNAYGMQCSWYKPSTCPSSLKATPKFGMRPQFKYPSYCCAKFMMSPI